MLPDVKKRQAAKYTGASAEIQDEMVTLYMPLDSNSEEIRLVTLTQGHFEDEIHCNLSKVSLKDGEFYEALSYAWGDPRLTRKIYLDGSSYPVTNNLESALRHLRHANKSRVLWIDALSINQKDIPERNSQVTHMSSIYKQASQVIAWLGEEGEDSSLVFDAFETLPSVDGIHWDQEDNSALLNVLSVPAYTTAICNFFQRSWWHRVWTVQESVLAQTLIFVCGRQQIYADKLFAVQKSRATHLLSCCYDGMRKFPHLHQISQAMDALYELSVTRRDRELHRLEEVIADYRSRQCENPRDRIYGLLGIVRDEDAALIVPDYATPVSLVYEDVTLKIIGHSQNLRIFSHICLQSLKEVENISDSWPSWVPNWTTRRSYYQSFALNVRLQRTNEYTASRKSTSQIKLIEQGKIGLRGVLFSTFAMLSEPHDSEDLYNYEIFQSWQDLVELDTDPSRSYDSITGTTYFDAYWQTLCCSILPSQSALDGTEMTRTSNQSIQQSWYEAWWSSYKINHEDVKGMGTLNSGVTKAEVMAFLRAVQVSTAMRKLFISEKEGWMGLAPMDTKHGDRIALLEGGGKVPYILRQIMGKKNEWEIIGDAFVYGIMDGEAWKPDQLVDLVLV